MVEVPRRTGLLLCRQKPSRGQDLIGLSKLWTVLTVVEEVRPGCLAGGAGSHRSNRTSYAYA